MKPIKTSLLAGAIALVAIPALAQTTSPSPTAPANAPGSAGSPGSTVTTVDKTAKMHSSDHYRASADRKSTRLNSSH